MRLTNKQQLPAPIVAAVTNDSYSKGTADISVTELLTPPQIVHLRKLHDDEIEEDVSDRIFSLLGQSVHSIIERASDGEDMLSELTLYTELEDWQLKGTVDHVSLSRKELLDFKVTSAWKVSRDEIPSEWVQQTNIYRWMLGKEKLIEINSVAILAILRDWSRNEARRNPTYPQQQALRLEVPLWTAEQTEQFVRERIRLHKRGGDVPCTEKDIWAKPTKWAVIKKGNTRAVKLFDTAAEAQEFALTISGSRVEMRPGEAVRCAGWCAVAPFCNQWKNDSRNVGAALGSTFSDFLS